MAVAQPHGQHQIARRHLLRFDIDDAVAAGARRQRRPHQPRPVERFRAHGERNAARLRTRDAQIDVVERPLLAVALVIDGEIAVLEADLAQLAAVEAGGAEAVDPGQERCKIRHDVARNCGRCRCAARGAALGDRTGERKLRRQRGLPSRRGDERALVVGTGENREPAVGLDAHLHLGADQAQPFGAEASGEQAGARHADLGLGRACHDRAVGIAHHDVADAQRRAAVGIALELGAADRNLMMAAEIFLDGGGEPRRGNVEFDRTITQPPPQRGHGDQRHRAKRGGDVDHLVQTHPPVEETQVSVIIAKELAHRKAPGRGRPVARKRGLLEQVQMDARLELAQCGNAWLPVLTRHAPLASPRSP